MNDEQQKRVRCFFAILLESHIHKVCQQVINQLKAQPGADSIKWSSTNQIHLTLHFLGHIPESTAHQLSTAALQPLQLFEPFTIPVKPLTLFPPKRPHTVVIPLAITDRLSELHRVIGEQLQAAGLQLEHRAYRPHITLGRFKKRPKLDLTSASRLLPSHIPINHLALMRSDLTSEGSIHTVIQDYWLEADN